MSTPQDTPPQQMSDDGYTGMPRWVKIQLVALAIFVLAVIVFIVIFKVGGDHGPGRHMSAPAAHYAPAISTER